MDPPTSDGDSGLPEIISCSNFLAVTRFIFLLCRRSTISPRDLEDI
jgi:hypothetical protein